jgi:hypothetical protein
MCLGTLFPVPTLCGGLRISTMINEKNVKECLSQYLYCTAISALAHAIIYRKTNYK